MELINKLYLDVLYGEGGRDAVLLPEEPLTEFTLSKKSLKRV